MTERERKIIEILIVKGTGDYIKGSEIAQLLNVSIKTIQNDIKYVKTIFNENGAEIEATSSKGYLLRITDYEKFKDYKKYIFISRNSNDFDDGLILCKKIIVHMLEEKCETIQGLSDLYYVSVSKMNIIIKKCKNILSHYDLLIEHKPSVGFQIVGEENKIRKLIIFERLPIYNMAGVNEGKTFITNKLTDIIVKTLMNERYLISDVVLENLVLYAYVMINRVQEDHVIVNVPDAHLISQHILEIAKKISVKIKHELGEDLPEKEIQYLALNLQAERAYENANAISSDTEIIIIDMLGYIKEKMNIDFTNDIDLRISLVLHIYPMLLRIKNNFQLKNELAEEIRKSYPLSYDIAVECAYFLQKYHEIKLSIDELAYLAVYFNLALSNQVEMYDRKKVLVICSERRGNSLMLRYMILNRFKNRIEQLDIINICDVQKTNLSYYDAVLSTTTDYAIVPANAVLINYFLNNLDYRIIENVLDGNDSNNDFNCFVSEDLFFKGNVEDKKELLYKLVHLATTKYRNLDVETISKSIERRESVGLTCFGNGIALPHPDEPIENVESFVVIGLLDKEIVWNEKDKVSIVFLICIRKNDSKSLMKLYDSIASLLSDEAAKNEIMKLESFNDFVNYMNNINLK